MKTTRSSISLFTAATAALQPAIAVILALTTLTTGANAQSNPGTRDTTSRILQLVYTSDAHFGITRKVFRGEDSVSSFIVNKAMIAQINTLPDVPLPGDGGVNAGNPVGGIDYLAQTGDIANRQEIPLQSATQSWAQFTEVYLNGLRTLGHNGRPTGFLIVPGNHDVSDAIGYPKPMRPLTDPAAMVGIYNMMMHPAVPLTAAAFNYDRDKVNYSRDIAGIHFVFLTIWPDSGMRVWMEKDLAAVSPSTPVVVFTHDPPGGDPEHFLNPFPPHTINSHDKFQNLLAETFKDDPAAEKLNDNIEQREWVAFLRAHPNIKAYFHGHENANEFYTYKGPDGDIALPIFRVDSPMKGKPSSTDETRLSFQLISIDTRSQTMTVRECLWNTHPDDPAGLVSWGQSRTISLRVAL